MLMWHPLSFLLLLQLAYVYLLECIRNEGSRAIINQIVEVSKNLKPVCAHI